MPGTTPIRNGKLQSALDFNDKEALNKTAAFSSTYQNAGGASHTLTAADAYNLIRFTGDRVLTIPANLDITPGAETLCFSTSGTVTIGITGGATVHHNGDGLVTADPYVVCSLLYLGDDEWLLTRK